MSVPCALRLTQLRAESNIPIGILRLCQLYSVGRLPLMTRTLQSGRRLVKEGCKMLIAT